MSAQPTRFAMLPALFAFLLALAPFSTFAQDDALAIPGVSSRAGGPMTVRAVLDSSALKPGVEQKLAVELTFSGKYHAHSNTPTPDKGFIATEIESTNAGDGVTFGKPVYPPGVNKDYPKIGGILNVYDGKVVILIPVTAKSDAKPGEVKIVGAVMAQICDDEQCLLPESFPFELATKIAAADESVAPNEPELFKAAGVATAAPPAPSSSSSASADAATGGRGIAYWFGIAFLVGIIFNIVPCVLPVLPIKAIGFYETAQHNRLRSVTYGLAFSVGVVAAFAVLGVLVVVLKVFAWGELFSNPIFTGVLVAILVAMAANMFGLFTINLPAGAYAFSPRHDTYFGNVLFGILTAALSTPCTFGLFVSVLTVALQATPTVGLLLIVVVGAGMAFPYVLLSAMPEVARKFPRTGPWAELVKQFMGFLILAVAVFFAQAWIVKLVESYLVYWLIFLVVAAGCVFLVIRSIQFGKTFRAPITAAIVALALLIPAFLAAQALGVKPYQWKPYQPELLADLRGQDRVVLVEFTADWCVNCHALEATVLNSKSIQRAVQQHGVEMVKADITDQTAASFKFWKFDVKAVGVPLTLVYPPGGADPIRLPGMYSRDDLEAALKQAAAKKTAMAQ